MTQTRTCALRAWLHALCLSAAAGCRGVEGDALSQRALDLGRDGSSARDAGDAGDALPTCVTEVLGAVLMCQTSALWQTRSSQACAAKGLVLGASGLIEACGVDSYRYIKFDCCPKDTMTCFTETQGAPTQCQDQAAWKMSASLSCSASGFQAISVAFIEPCGTGTYRYAQYQCCPRG